jgi:hypothetical protein
MIRSTIYAISMIGLILGCSDQETSKEGTSKDPDVGCSCLTSPPLPQPAFKPNPPNLSESSFLAGRIHLRPVSSSNYQDQLYVIITEIEHDTDQGKIIFEQKITLGQSIGSRLTYYCGNDERFYNIPQQNCCSTRLSLKSDNKPALYLESYAPRNIAKGHLSLDGDIEFEIQLDTPDIRSKYELQFFIDRDLSTTLSYGDYLTDEPVEFWAQAHSSNLELEAEPFVPAYASDIQLHFHDQSELEIDFDLATDLVIEIVDLGEPAPAIGIYGSGQPDQPRPVRYVIEQLSGIEELPEEMAINLNYLEILDSHDYRIEISLNQQVRKLMSHQLLKRQREILEVELKLAPTDLSDH